MMHLWAGRVSAAGRRALERREEGGKARFTGRRERGARKEDIGEGEREERTEEGQDGEWHDMKACEGRGGESEWE